MIINHTHRSQTASYMQKNMGTISQIQPLTCEVMLHSCEVMLLSCEVMLHSSELMLLSSDAGNYDDMWNSPHGGDVIMSSHGALPLQRHFTSDHELEETVVNMSPSTDRSRW